jgi:predicted anti-sigma-YlaC factor YlaD
MNCHAAQRLLSAERDGALASHERADLEGHLAECGDCRQARSAITAAIDRWRTSTARVKVPDAERAWQDIHREIRLSSPEKKRETQWAVPRWTLPMTAAAALIVAAIAAPRWFGGSISAPTQTVAKLETARADFVEVANNASSVVYVDDKSGWLVVWAVNDKL